MRTKNSLPLTADELEHLAFVKQCACVFCNKAGGEAHHPRQGRHFMTVACCPTCHAAKAWMYGLLNEFDAVNETHRRVAALRSGRRLNHAATLPRCRQRSTRTPVKRRGTNLSSPKQLPRANP